MSLVSKILDYIGKRVEGTYWQYQLRALWKQSGISLVNEVDQSTRNKFDEVQVGLNENVEVLAPAMNWGQDSQGNAINTPYSGTPAWDFTEEGEYQLGDMVWMVTEGEHAGMIVSQQGADSDIPLPCPSLILDTAGNQHVVYPVWGWLADGGYAFRPATITFRHNASYKGGDLDSHGMFDITLIGSASAAQTITGLQTTQEVKVGQFGQFETTVNGVTKPWPCIVTAVTEPAQEGDPYTFSLLTVSEAAGTVTNLQLYQKYGV